MSACSGEPVSWLRLERYALGELSGDEQRAVAEHLAGCAVCRACSEHIARAVPELPPLMAATPVPARKRQWPRLGPWAALASAGLCAWLMLRAPHLPPEAASGMTVSSTKGGDIALSVVRRDREGRLLDPRRFAASDRFKLLLTCAPPLSGAVRVLIFQAGERYEPVPEQSLPQCGNRRPLEGAWQLDGRAPLDICVVFSERADASQLASARSADALGALPVPHACARLDPVE